jgi:hypothetical protein
LGNIIPEHATDMKVKYGKGLALNSMEGREAKHISISRYSKNTNFKARWEQIFQHEYVSLVWLGENGYNFEKPASECCSRYMYIPKRATEDSKFCYCGCEKQVQSASCRFCNHKLRKKIMGKVKGFFKKIGQAGWMLLVARCCGLQAMYKVLEIFMLGVKYNISWVESYVRHQKFYNICIVLCIF